jgi:hypothetical protein
MKQEYAFRLYVLYENLIKLTNPTKDFCKLKQLLNFKVRDPSFYIVNAEENKNIELYIQRIKQASSKESIELKTNEETLVTMDSNEIINSHFMKFSDRQNLNDKKLVTKSLNLNKFSSAALSDRLQPADHKKQYTLINADSSILEFSDEKKNGSIEHQLFDLGYEENKSDL